MTKQLIYWEAAQPAILSQVAYAMRSTARLTTDHCGARLTTEPTDIGENKHH